jgi:hypothetical protein
VSKNSKGGARRRSVTVREMQAEFRGIRTVDELEDVLEDWGDDDFIVESPKKEYRFDQD